MDWKRITKFKEIPLRESDRGNGFFQLYCPICDLDYSHMQLITLQTRDLFPPALSRKGQFDQEMVSLNFACENGHEYYLIFATHKGWIFAWYEIKQINYREYINSPEWVEKSQEAKERANFRCQLCNKEDKLQTHHKTYENLGYELPEDLIVLCDECHAKFHDKLAQHS